MNKFQIIVPTRNSGETLPKLVNSFQKQTFSNWEVIFIDASTKNKDINWLKNLCLKDERFIYKVQNNKGKKIFGAMNQGLEITHNNSWILFWGSDDWVIRENTFEELNNKINKLKDLNLDLIICKGKYFKNNNCFYKNTYFTNNIYNRTITPHKYRSLLFRGFTPPHQSTIMNSKLFNSEYRYDETFLIAGDLDFFCKLIHKKTISIYQLNTFIVSISCGGISSKNHIKRLKEVKKSYKNVFGYSYFIPFLCRYFFKFFKFVW